jgi:hypothetical protein
MTIHKNLLGTFIVCAMIVLLSISTFSQKRPVRKKSVTPSATSKTLTRPFAANLIKDHENFIGTLYRDVPVGPFWFEWRDIDAYVKRLKPLIDKTLLTFEATGRKNNERWHEYIINLTATGEIEVKLWEKTTRSSPGGGAFDGYFGPPSPNCTIYQIPLAKKQLLEITGIAIENGESADVEFQWAWVATEKAALFPNFIYSKDKYSGKAAFRLYDDGWRLVLFYY